MSARRVSRRQPQRGAVPAVDPRIRGEVGAIALLAFALLARVLVGVVVASNRTLGDLIRPAWERRTALRPGVSLPGGTAGRFGRGVDEPEDEDVSEPAPPLRINLPVERPKGAAQPPK